MIDNKIKLNNEAIITIDDDDDDIMANDPDSDDYDENES